MPISRVFADGFRMISLRSSRLFERLYWNRGNPPKRSRESLRRCSIETSLAIVSLIGNNIYTYLKSLWRGLRKAAVTRTRSLTREIYTSDIKYGIGTIKGHYGDLPRQSKVKWLSYSIAINPIPPCKITIRDLYSLVPRKSGAIRHIRSVFRLSFLLSTRDRVVNAHVHHSREKKYATRKRIYRFDAPCAKLVRLF